MRTKIQNQISEILSKYPGTRRFYREYINLSDENLYSLLTNWVKIKEKREKILDIKNLKIFDYIIDGYLNLLKLNPIEIWKKIEFKNLNEMRMDFEELKREMKISGKKIIGKISPEDENNFKFASTHSGGDFNRGFDRLDLRI